MSKMATWTRTLISSEPHLANVRCEHLKAAGEGRRPVHRRWHLDKVLVKMNGERHSLWRADDHGVAVSG